MKELVWYILSMKDFDGWNILKQRIDSRVPAFHVKEREFWYVHLGINVGVEENGKGSDFKRPVLVMKKIGNIFAVLPLTTK